VDNICTCLCTCTVPCCISQPACTDSSQVEDQQASPRRACCQNSNQIFAECHQQHYRRLNARPSTVSRKRDRGDVQDQNLTPPNQCSPQTPLPPNPYRVDQTNSAVTNAAIAELLALLSVRSWAMPQPAQTMLPGNQTARVSDRQPRCADSSPTVLYLHKGPTPAPQAPFPPPTLLTPVANGVHVPQIITNSRGQRCTLVLSKQLSSSDCGCGSRIVLPRLVW
jgi:hypothetical protein